jgi:hypothetical protein
MTSFTNGTLKSNPCLICKLFSAISTTRQLLQYSTHQSEIREARQTQCTVIRQVTEVQPYRRREWREREKLYTCSHNTASFSQSNLWHRVLSDVVCSIAATSPFDRLMGKMDALCPIAAAAGSVDMREEGSHMT